MKLASNDYDTPGDFSLIFEEGKSASQITKELATYMNGARYCDAGSSAKGCSDLNYKIKYASLIKMEIQIQLRNHLELLILQELY